MREIKFRGKRVDNGKWVYGYVQLDFFKEILRNSYIIEQVELDNSRDFDIYSVIPETVGQFTGLSDKNGIDIYEGDIFKYSLPDLGCEEYDKPQTYTEYIEEVVFEDGQFTLEVMPVYAAIGDETNGEVIGNIYSNPELINNKEEVTN